jgi:outer membrane translocation and assembly module TamA
VIREKEEHGKKPPKVLVEIRITPGKPVIIRRLETEGLAELSFDAAEAAIFDSRLRIGQLFDEDEYQAAKTDLLESLSNRGYAFAQVTTKAKVDIAAHSAEVVLSAQPGPRAHLGKISVMGLKRLSERAVRRVLDLKEGDLYSHREIRAARAALFDLGVFSRVEVLPRLDNPESATVPVVVRLKEAALRDVTLGGGLRLDTLRLATVGQASWTHRNFLGGLRKLTVSTRPGLTFFPTSIDYFHAPTNVFAENFASVRGGTNPGLRRRRLQHLPAALPLAGRHEPQRRASDRLP